MEDDVTIVAAAFKNEDDARQALDELRQAGFGYDQVGVAPQGQNDIKLQEDLETLGVPDDVATYYGQQHKAGSTVVSVRPDGQDEFVHNLFHRYNGYDYQHQNGLPNSTVGSNAERTQASETYSQNEFHQPRSLRPRNASVTVSPDVAQNSDTVTE